MTGIGTAVAIYPILKRYGPGRAAGFVASRTLEAAVIFAGVLAILTVYTLRQDAAGADPAVLTTTGIALIAVREWSQVSSIAMLMVLPVAVAAPAHV